MSELNERIKNCMIDHLKFISSADEIGDAEELAALGMDSMAATNIMIDLEDEFDIQFPDEMLTPETFKSVESLGQAIQSIIGERAVA